MSTTISNWIDCSSSNKRHHQNISVDCSVITSRENKCNCNWWRQKKQNVQTVILENVEPAPFFGRFLIPPSLLCSDEEDCEIDDYFVWTVYKRDGNRSDNHVICEQRGDELFKLHHIILGSWTADLGLQCNGEMALELDEMKVSLVLWFLKLYWHRCFFLYTIFCIKGNLLWQCRELNWYNIFDATV
jgi:hypothetical protein